MQESFAWFEKLGWEKGWEWGDPPDFGGVCSGKSDILTAMSSASARVRTTELFQVKARRSQLSPGTSPEWDCGDLHGFSRLDRYRSSVNR